MGVIMKNGISYGGGSGTVADTSHIELTFAEYKELENQGKVDDDTIYFITDEDINGNNNVDNLVELTQAEYDELGDVVNSDNKTYYITDSEEELDASMITFDDTETQMGVSDVQGAISKLNKNKQDIITNLVDVDPDTIKNTCVILTSINTPSGHVMMIASVGDGTFCVQIATEYVGYGTGATYVRNNINKVWSGWYQLK